MWFKSECDKITDRLWDYTAQRLSVTETAQIEQHLQQCAKCQAEAEGYRQTLGLLSAARSMHVPASQTTWRDLRPSLQPERRSVTRSADWLPRLTLAGAGTVMAATLLVVFLNNGRHPGGIAPAVNPPNAVVQNVPAPEQNTVAENATNATHESSLPVMSGPTVAGFAQNMFPTLPKPQGVLKPTTPTLPSTTVERLTRTRRNYTHAPRWASNVGRTHPSVPAVTPTRPEGDSGTQQTQQNYVLKTVSPTSDDETVTSRRYVMSSIPSSQGAVASNDGGDEGRAW